MNSNEDNIEADAGQVKHWTLFDADVFKRFVKPGEVVEVRILGATGKSVAWGGWARGTVSGYFDDHTAFSKWLKMADRAKHKGAYITLQVIDPRLIGRALNRLITTDITTSDHNVIAYRWLPIDLDPVRPAGISSSDSELAAAMALREEVAEWIVSNMDLPAPLKAMSGNGAHLLFRLPDLPVNEKHQEFVKSTLNGLSKRFDNDMVTIDRSVFNPARIWKAYGTTARKGDPIPASQYQEARPHRMAYVDDLGRCE
jgi:hypothetical protein